MQLSQILHVRWVDHETYILMNNVCRWGTSRSQTSRKEEGAFRREKGTLLAAQPYTTAVMFSSTRSVSLESNTVTTSEMTNHTYRQQNLTSSRTSPQILSFSLDIC